MSKTVNKYSEQMLNKANKMKQCNIEHCNFIAMFTKLIERKTKDYFKVYLATQI